MTKATVELSAISKRYTLGENIPRYDTLREAIYRTVNLRGRSGGDSARVIWALRDVTLSLGEGEVLGIIGANGAGKTTLLKVVARITEPTSGRGRIRGRVGSLLETGTGFHYELTGRENIFLGGTILGMGRHEIRRRFDQIVEFAGVGPLLDTPLKRYSAGMHLRLTFAVAAQLDTEILVVDEVLAVGDAEFREKCLGTMSDFGHSGRTVLFVSHDLAAVRQLCTRAVWLDGGTVHADGSPDEVINAYTASIAETASEVQFSPVPESSVHLLSVALVDTTGSLVRRPRRDRPLCFRIRFRTEASIRALDLGISLFGAGGTRLVDEYFSDVEEFGLDAEAGVTYEVVVTLPPVLPAGNYRLSLWFASRFETFLEREIMTVRLWPAPDDRGDALERERVLQPEVDWRLQSLGGGGPSSPAGEAAGS